MGHSERYEENLFKNISGNKQQDIFQNAVNYFKKPAKQKKSFFGKK
jgi:phosphoribosylformylglycinamidine synthase